MVLPLHGIIVAMGKRVFIILLYLKKFVKRIGNFLELWIQCKYVPIVFEVCVSQDAIKMIIRYS